MKILDNSYLGITLLPHLFVISLIKGYYFKISGFPLSKRHGSVEDQGTARAGPGRKKS